MRPKGLESFFTDQTVCPHFRLAAVWQVMTFPSPEQPTLSSQYHNSPITRGTSKPRTMTTIVTWRPLHLDLILDLLRLPVSRSKGIKENERSFIRSMRDRSRRFASGSPAQASRHAFHQLGNFTLVGRVNTVFDFCLASACKSRASDKDISGYTPSGKVLRLS